MNIRTITVDRLTPDEIAAWSAIQRDNPLLDSPYFRPEFTQAVAAVRNDVEVAVLEAARRPVGFFPYQRSSWNVGRPVGGRLSDCQAVIAGSDVIYDPKELLRGCQLSAWRFDHLLTEQTAFAPFVWREADAPYLDLTEGFEAYSRSVNGQKFLPEYRRKKRKVEREIGPVRFEPNVRDQGILSTLIAWKSQQYLRTKVPNVFDFPWTRSLLEKVLEFDGADFSPMLSVLYIADRIAAIDYQLFCRGVLHGWFPAYDVELSRHSPGVLLWIETMMAAERLGIRRIDLGKGPERYKYRCMTGTRRLAEGTVDIRPVKAIVRRAWQRTRDRIRSSPLYGPARVPARMLYQLRSWLELR